MKKLFIILFSLFITFNVSAFTKNQNIYDYGQVLTEKEEEKIQENINNYKERYSEDLYIITLKYYSVSNLDLYIDSFNKKYESQIDNKNYTIVSFDTLKDDFNIKSFGNINKNIDKNELIKEKNNYYEKINYLINNLQNYSNIKEDSTKDDINFILILIISLIVSLIIILLLLITRKKNKIEYSFKYRINDINISNIDDVLVTTHTEKI